VEVSSGSEQRYQYRARKRNGQLVVGEVIAATLDEANSKVKNQGLIPVQVSPWRESSWPQLSDLSWAGLSTMLIRVTPKDILIFTQQLQTIYTVGVPIVDGLRMIADQTENAKLRKVIVDVVSHVSDGAALATAMSRHPHVFDEVYVNMIRVGEASGQLEEVLSRLYQVIESQAENRNRIKSAMFYPKLVVGMIVVVFVVMMAFVVPKLKIFYSAFGGGELPLPTRIVIGISNFVTDYFLLWGGLAILGTMAFRRWVRTPKGGLIWDSWKLKLPIIGALIVEIEMNSFCVILEMLVRSGLGIVQSLEVLMGTLSNRVVRRDIENCRKHTMAGGRMGDSLRESRTFPKMLSGLVAVGEETGSMEKVLLRTARFYQTQIDYKISNLSKAIEPLLLAITFSFVLLLALAIFLPIWNMSSALKR